VEALKWPDATVDSAGGSAGGVWHHYAWTFTNGLFRGYLNGTNFPTTASAPSQRGSNTVPLTALTMDINGWLAIGCKTHFTSPIPYETPEFGDDLYPNHGWMNGHIDDIRIYNRVLTDSEIHAVYSGSEVVDPPVVPPAPDPPSVFRIATAGSATAGSVSQ